MKEYIKNQFETKPFGGTVGISIILLAHILILIFM